MARKLGVSAEHGNDHSLLVLSDPTEEEISVALERLTDPFLRLLHEIFWLWPVTSDATTDQGLSALERGDVQAAIEEWSKVSDDPTTESLKEHNLAVLNHLIALEFEAWIADRPDSALRTRYYRHHSGEAYRVWLNALRGWQAVIRNDLFWRLVARRAKDLDDPRLTAERVQGIREQILGALPNINATLAVQAAERGDEERAKVHTQLLTTDLFDRDAEQAAVHAALLPVRERIQALCRQAETEADTAVDRAADTITNLLKQSRPLLQLFDLLLREEDVLRTGIYDQVAETALQATIGLSNASEDWEEALRLLDLIRPFVKGSGQRRRFETNYETVQRNIAAERCFFCGKEKGDPEETIEFEMYGDVQNYGYRIAWRQGVVKVPRCTTCARLHKRREALQLLIGGPFWILSCIWVGVDIYKAPKLPMADFGWVGVVIGLLVVLWMVSVMTNLVVGIVRAIFAPLQGRKDEADAKSFPAIEERLSNGWEFGKQPPGTQG